MERIDTLLARMQREVQHGRPVVDMGSGVMGIFDGSLAARIDADNHRAARVPDTIIETLAARQNVPDWKVMREALIRCTRRLTTPEPLAALEHRMRAALHAAAGQKIDFSAFLECMIPDSLRPVIIDTASPRGADAIARDQHIKAINVITPMSIQFSRMRRWRDKLAQIQASRAVRRELAQRLTRRRPPQQDMAEEVIAHRGELSLGQMTYVVTGILTAAAGAPGSVNSCALYALHHYPEEGEAVRAELAAVSREALLAGPVAAAPVTYRFLREVMRMWAFPLMSDRIALIDLDAAGCPIARGTPYKLSSFVQHHDPRYWDDPDTFRPARWLDKGGGAPRDAYVPFGWPTRTCTGASLGLAQLFLFVRLMTQEFAVTLDNPERLFIRLEGVAIPDGFIGTLRRLA